jgi:hypothetical protein
MPVRWAAPMRIGKGGGEEYTMIRKALYVAVGSSRGTVKMPNQDWKDLTDLPNPCWERPTMATRHLAHLFARSAIG